VYFLCSAFHCSYFFELWVNLLVDCLVIVYLKLRCTATFFSSSLAELRVEYEWETAGDAAGDGAGDNVGESAVVSFRGRPTLFLVMLATLASISLAGSGGWLFVALVMGSGGRLFVIFEITLVVGSGGRSFVIFEMG
jgi:hypothetical protein